MRLIAKLISVLFHPLLFPSYGAMLIVATNPNMFGRFGERLHIVWLIIVFALTFIFPVVWMLMMKKLEMIESLEVSTAKERIVPFIATATFYLWCTWMFKPSVTMKIPPNQLIFYMMLGASLGVFISFIINIYSKVSLHGVGAGALVGLVLVMTRYSTFDLRVVFVCTILLAGIIGTARLLLDAHTPRQVFMGYMVGFTGQFNAYSLLPHLID
jgi:membrane-associated phospholipid phosphatase